MLQSALKSTTFPEPKILIAHTSLPSEPLSKLLWTFSVTNGGQEKQKILRKWEAKTWRMAFLSSIYLPNCGLLRGTDPVRSLSFNAKTWRWLFPSLLYDAGMYLLIWLWSKYKCCKETIPSPQPFGRSSDIMLRPRSRYQRLDMYRM